MMINTVASFYSLQAKPSLRFGYAPVASAPTVAPSYVNLSQPGGFSQGQLILSTTDRDALKKTYSSGGVASKYPIGALMDMYRLKLEDPTKTTFSFSEILNNGFSTGDQEREIRALGRALHALSSMREPLIASYMEGQYRLTPKGQKLAKILKDQTPLELQAGLRSDSGVVYAFDNLVNAQVISIQDNFQYIG